MSLASHLGVRVALGTGIALTLLTAVFVLSRAGQPAHAQPSAPITITEQAITLDAANIMIAAATARAREMGVAVSVVVVDGHGLEKAMVRMDGARVTSANVAYGKANTAAVRQQTSEAYGQGLLDNPLLLHSAFAVQPNIFVTPGGLPIIVDGQVVGAIGSGGGSASEDLQIATAGLAAIQ